MRVVLVLFLLWPLQLWAQGSRPFDPLALGQQDTRFLQAALAWSGDYVGLTDGAWGDQSRAALAAWLGSQGADPGRPTDADLQPLLFDLVAEVEAGGWQVMNFDGPMSVALPTALLVPGPEMADAVELKSADGALVVRILFGTPEAAEKMHDRMAEAHVGPDVPYRSEGGDRQVSSVTLANGKGVYLRTALVDGVAVSMQVVSEPREEARADLIAATMQWGAAPELWPEPGGPIDRLLLAASGPFATPADPFPGGPGLPPAAAPPAAALPAAPPVVAMAPGSASKPGTGGGTTIPAAPTAPAMPTWDLVGTGTGFYVDPAHVVTAAHVVEGCQDLRLEDGSALRVLSLDPVLDLAVLAADRASPHWLPIPPGDAPQLGERVFALGFPYFGLDLVANQGLSVTGGNVSALPRVVDAAARVMMTAPVQPGNSGGPLLGGDGAVLGVVVAQANEGFVQEQTGSLPQNMNFAVSVSQLVPFLAGAGVALPPATGPAAADLAQGVPDAVQAAVVLVGCY